MFGIGLPEMIVILAVALIVVGPDKLPDMARNIAKWMFELKKTVNEVKNSLTDEDNLIGSVKSDLQKTADDLKGELLESDDNFTWYEPGSPARKMAGMENEIIKAEDLKPISGKADPYPKGQDKVESEVDEEDDSSDSETDNGKMKGTPPESTS